MAKSVLRIISRESPLAMWQAEYVRDQLLAINPGFEVRIIGVSTEADRFLDSPIDKLGGKGAFVKELELALLEGKADLAVHSMKDVVVTMPEKLTIAAILRRTDAGDAYVSDRVPSMDDLPAGSIVGTSSLRRQCQLKAWRPDLEVKGIRGNVGTRLKKLDAGDFDALILASSGLKRLGLQARIRHEINTGLMMPAIGQGALGIEIRSDDEDVRKLIIPLNDKNTFECVTAEREVNKCLNGGCLAPVAAHAISINGKMKVSGLVGTTDGMEILREEVSGNADDYVALGRSLGKNLVDRGAERILSEYR